ncbi:hypothetical protein [Actinoplanes sp. NPDC051851]|uniref:hypothetical protein n=1 Tax=Actinoplanes sp. NPDC051851 TaxID=3154753 RepID=UPI00341D4E00
MGRKTGTGRAVERYQRRVHTWGFVFMALLYATIGLPATFVVFFSLERFGADTDKAIATGTATVTSCEHHALGTPYTCAATATWHTEPFGDQPPTTVTVHSMRSLSGEVAVEERSCRSYAYRHGCRIYTADFPKMPGILYLPMIIATIGLLIVTVLPGRPLARLFIRNPAKRG